VRVTFSALKLADLKVSRAPSCITPGNKRRRYPIRWYRIHLALGNYRDVSPARGVIFGLRRMREITRGSEAFLLRHDRDKVMLVQSVQPVYF
jgi:hypothetical protein